MQVPESIFFNAIGSVVFVFYGIWELATALRNVGRVLIRLECSRNQLCPLTTAAANRVC